METSVTVKLSEDAIVNIIRTIRNDLIKDFLDERNLTTYFASRYNIPELPSVKVEFIKRDLRAYLIAPVDTMHYQSLIDTIRESGSAALSEGNDQLFYKDLENIFRNYTY